MIQCDLIMGEAAVNEWLREHKMRPVHAEATSAEPPLILERSDVSTALLGEHAEGIANVLLVVDEDKYMRVLRVSLALLENICEAMRAKVGPDQRLVDEAG